MKTLFFLLISNICFSQSMKILLNVETVPANSANTPNSKSTEIVTLIFEQDNIGIITSKDTLALVKIGEIKPLTHNPVSDPFVYLYQDEHHNGQKYYVTFRQDRKSFSIFISVMKPYIRKANSIILRSI
jgi:hypothetical protein